MIRILLIEDDTFLSDVLLQKLTSAGYIVELARDGSKGLTRMRETMPDLVLIDVFLPLLNGIEVMQEKKEDPVIKDIPVIMLTNSLVGGEIENLGVDEFLIKAKITPEEILTKVKSVIAKRGISDHAEGSSELEGKTILLVEDDSFLSSILSAKLFNKKVNVIQAGSGEAALEVIKEQLPDLVLLDILLPGINGFEVLQSLRSDPKTKDVSVIVLSNFNQKEDIDKAHTLGATYFVKALVTPSEIITSIEKFLSEKKAA